MPKQNLQERFQQLAGIKPLYEQLGPRMRNPRPTGPSDDKDDSLDTTWAQTFGLSDDNTYLIEDLTFEMIKKTFFRYYKNVKFTRPQTDEPYYSDSVSFPNWDDSSTPIADESAWQKWREEIMNSYGNVKIQLNPGADGFDVKYAEILDDKFNQERDKFGKGKAASIQRDQERGWSID